MEYMKGGTMKKEFLQKIVGIIVLGIFFGSSVEVLGSNFYYYSEGRKIELTPVLDKLVVKFQPKVKEEDKRELLAKFGLHMVSEENPFGLAYVDNSSKNLALDG